MTAERRTANPRNRQQAAPLSHRNHAVARAVRASVPGDAVVPIWEDLRRAPDTAPIEQPALQSRDALFRRGLAAADVGAAYLALLAVLLIGSGSISLRPAAILIAPFALVASKAIGLYDRDEHTLRKTTIDELPSILYLSISYALAVWLAEVVVVQGRLGRPEVFGLAVACFATVTAGRALARHVVLALVSPERCVVIGDGTDAIRTAHKLENSSGVKATVIGRVPLDADDQDDVDVPTLGDIDSLASVVAAHDVERAIIAPSSDDGEEALHAIRLLKALGVKVSVLPRLLEVVGSSSIFDEVDGITLLGVRQYGLSKSSAFLKRTMDAFGAALGIALLSPLFVILALLIKLDSCGPVFFRQPRIGRRGKRFQMFKFRSMVNDAEEQKGHVGALNEAGGGLFKIADDPRVTRVGRFLRQTSIDELPQLFNVLVGDMSLVGPRPLVPAEDALIEGWQRRRVALKPGITGLWQIFGSARIPMQEMVKIDYLYGANWSVWLDTKVLLRTIPYIVRRKGM